jgi:FkbM family methyltransferase
MFDAVRRARLRAIVSRQLSNGADVWSAHRASRALPPLHFRNGLVLRHGEGDAPLFLLFEIFANGCYRRRLGPVQRDGVIVDIGANIGTFTLDCAMRFPSSRIEAYEPNPRAFRVLQENIAANRLEGRVRAYGEAVGRACGELAIWESGSSLAATAYPRAADRANPPARRPMVDLRTVVARASGAAAVVKLDAEGAEADIVDGGGAILRRVSQFVGEYHVDRVPDVIERCRSAFEQSNFEFAWSCTRRCGPLFHARRID